VTDILHLTPRPAPATLVAWQFVGQPLHEWPSWVQSSCTLQRDVDGKLELCHERRSGAQIVYLNEWLVRDLDGGISYYSDDELRSAFETSRR
jgi:hypothetical protein